MKPFIAFYGAVDRFNFGDLLFPRVLKHFAPPHFIADYRWAHLALIDSDLSPRGGRRVFSVRRLLKRPPPDRSVVIVPGGEVLTATVSDLYSCLFDDLHVPRGSSKELKPADDNLRAMGRLGVPWRLPFVPRPHQIPGGPRTAFMGVGGQSLAAQSEEVKRWVVAALAESTFASVRDPVTQAGVVSSGGAQVFLTPDSVHAIGLMHSRLDLIAKASSAAAAVIRKHADPGYFCFQSAHRHLAKDPASAATQIDALSAETGLFPVLLPAGTALGHEDHIGLQMVSSAMRAPHVCVWFPSVMDVVALLANARIVLATSLHATVIAMSYGVPRLPFSGLERKTANYVAAWDPENLVENADYTTMVSYSIKALAKNPMELKQHADLLASRAKEAIDSMWSSLM